MQNIKKTHIFLDIADDSESTHIYLLWKFFSNGIISVKFALAVRYPI